MSDYTGPGIYTLESVATNTVVNLAGSGSDNGTKIIGYKKTNGINERWQIAHAGDDEYFIINAATGTYVTAADEDNVVLTGNLLPPTSKSIRWKITAAKTGAGGYVFHSVSRQGKVLDLRESNPDNNTAVIVWGEHGGKNQEWLLKLPDTPASLY